MDPQFLIAFLMILSGAIGYLADRWITKRGKAEDADSVLRTVELKKCLEEAGLSFAEARELRDRLYSGREPITPAMAKAMIEGEPLEGAVADDTRDLSFSETTEGIKLGMGTRLHYLRDQIDLALADLIYQSSENRRNALTSAQAAWEEYCRREAEAAGLLWEGGTGAPILGLSRQLDLAETRLNELRLMKAEADAT